MRTGDIWKMNKVGALVRIQAMSRSKKSVVVFPCRMDGKRIPDTITRAMRASTLQRDFVPVP